MGSQLKQLLFFHETPFLFENIPKREIAVIQTCVCGIHVLENKLVTSREIIDNLFMKEFEFYTQMRILCQNELDSF